MSEPAEYEVVEAEPCGARLRIGNWALCMDEAGAHRLLRAALEAVQIFERKRGTVPTLLLQRDPMTLTKSVPGG